MKNKKTNEFHEALAPVQREVETVECTLVGCDIQGQADEMFWDSEFDLPYHSAEHMAEDRENRLMDVMDVEDDIFGFGGKL